VCYKTRHEGQTALDGTLRQASVEQDHQKLMELINEITRLLDEKETRLRPASPTPEDTK
jgi:hypothetical protein